MRLASLADMDPGQSADCIASKNSFQKRSAARRFAAGLRSRSRRGGEEDRYDSARQLFEALLYTGRAEEAEVRAPTRPERLGRAARAGEAVLEHFGYPVTSTLYDGVWRHMETVPTSVLNRGYIQSHPREHGCPR